METGLRTIVNKMNRILEYTELMPTDTKMKDIIKVYLLEYLKNIKVEIENLSDFLEKLDNCSTEEEVTTLIMKMNKSEKYKSDSGFE